MSAHVLFVASMIGLVVALVLCVLALAALHEAKRLSDEAHEFYDLAERQLAYVLAIDSEFRVNDD